jgi:hypothetical protein
LYRLCPPEFKKEMDDEVFYLLHTTNVEGQDDNGIKKLEVMTSSSLLWVIP